MHLPQLLDSFTPETDPVRRGWQVYVAAAWAVLPTAPVPVLVEQAIEFAGPCVEADRRLVEEVALEMLFARAGEAA